MTITDFMNEVSRTVDTEKTGIDVADTRRVLSEAFKLLASLDSVTACHVVANGMANAAKKAKPKCKKTK